MYNLFLVYDKKENENNIYSSINWDKYDVTISGESSSIKDSYKKILKSSPDIIIIDISEDKLSTINLLEQLNKTKFKNRSIVVSSFNDISFMEETIKLNALNYLLKPCKDFDIVKEVLIAKNKIVQYKKTPQFSILDKNHSLFRNSILKEVLLGNFGDIHGIKEIIPFYKINLINTSVVASILDIDELNNSSSKKELDVRIDLIKELLVDNFNEFEHWEILELNGKAIFIICLENEFLYKYLLDSFNKLKNLIKYLLGFTVTIAIGSTVPSLDKLHLSYKDSVTALDSKLFYGDDSIISINNVSAPHFSSDFYPIDETIALIESVKVGDTLEVRNNLDMFYKSLVKYGIPSKVYVQDSTTRLVSNLQRHCVSATEEKSKFFTTKTIRLTNLLNCNTIEKIKEQILLFVDDIINKNTKIATTNKLINSAIDYIVKNYSDNNITLELVANEIYITPVYLSKLFKQETGINFLEFLHKFRIDQSKHYLRNTNDKIYEISSFVGYTNEKHFSKMFKKYVGISPTDYRQLEIK